MLIKKGDHVINLNNVTEFRKSCYREENEIEFSFFLYKTDLEEIEKTWFSFESKEKRDSAFERILEDYRWQRMQCTID